MEYTIFKLSNKRIKYSFPFHPFLFLQCKTSRKEIEGMDFNKFY